MEYSNGGYIMVDFKGVNLPEEPATEEVVGIYNAVAMAFAANKPVVACNFTITYDGNDYPVSPTHIFVYPGSEEVYLCDVGVYRLYVNPDDTVYTECLTA